MSASEELPRRNALPVRVFRRGEEPSDDLSSSASAEERQELLDAGVRYVVVGAHAMAVHEFPRATQNLDVWIDRDPDKAVKVLQAVAHVGAPLNALGVTVNDLTTPGMVIQIGLPPNRIDVLTAISGVEDFAAAWDARVEHGIRGRAIPFLDLERLRQNKRASGRRKDLADLEQLGGHA